MNPRGFSVPALKLLSAARPLVIGHRGFCAVAPENTIPSFRAGLNAGADLIELDIHTTRDGVPVVMHDDTLDRTTNACAEWGRRRVAVANTDSTALQTLDAGSWFGSGFAGTRVPLLIEALDVIRRAGGTAVIERKSGEASSLAELLKRKGLVNRVIVISFDWDFLKQFHKILPAQALGALGPVSHFPRSGKPPEKFSKRLGERWLDQLKVTGAKIVVWNSQVSRSSIALAHERGLKVWVYTVNDGARARRLLKQGVDGLITNRVERIRRTVDQFCG